MWSCIGRSLLPRATPLLATAARAVVARRAFVSPTAVRREAQTANVPSMGDSITEVRQKSEVPGMLPCLAETHILGALLYSRERSWNGQCRSVGPCKPKMSWP